MNDSMSFFCLHRFALSTNPRITPVEISRYRLIPMSVLLISRQPMKLQISFGFAMPTTNPRTGMLWERDWPELCPPLTRERACSGNEIVLRPDHAYRHTVTSIEVRIWSTKMADNQHFRCINKLPYFKEIYGN